MMETPLSSRRLSLSATLEKACGAAPAFVEKAHRLAAYLDAAGNDSRPVLAVRLEHPLQLVPLILASALVDRPIIMTDPAISASFALQPIPLNWEAVKQNPKPAPRSLEPWSPEGLSKGNLLVPTSGSSGRPKLVVHSLASLTESAVLTLEYYSLAPSSGFSQSLPTTHMGGIMAAWRGFIHGAPIWVPESRSDPLKLTATPSDVYSLVPTQLRRCMDEPLATKRLQAAQLILIGGAACPRDWLREARQKGIPIQLSYGSTETAGQIMTADPTQSPLVYTPLPGRQVKLSHDKLTCFGPGCALGYWRQPRESSGFLLNDKMAYIEASGGFEILGRTDRSFQCGGETVDPEFIEGFLQKNLGIPVRIERHCHAELGHIPIARVEASAAISENHWQQLLTQLTPGQRPRQIEHNLQIDRK